MHSDFYIKLQDKNIGRFDSSYAQPDYFAKLL